MNLLKGHDYSAPYWMGEFGTGDNGDKWQYIIQFLKVNSAVHYPVLKGKQYSTLSSS